jgi:hypothetical protein
MGNVRSALLRTLQMGIIKRKKTKSGLDFNKSSADNFNKALFDFCILELDYYNPKISDYVENNFDSWNIEFAKSRLIYSGKEQILTLQIKRRQGWCDDKCFQEIN